MILDRLENAGKHSAPGPELARAFEYLRKTDFSKVPNGRYELDGDRVYAVVQRYRPKPLSEAAWEAHRRYIDVQYMVQGSERMGYAPLGDGLPVRQQYDPATDAVLYHANGEFFTVAPGSFAVFSPEDVHAPCLAAEGAGSNDEVCKVVVKCRVAEV